MKSALSSITLFIDDDTEVEASTGTLDIALTDEIFPWTPSLQIHAAPSGSRAEQYGRLHDFFVRCAEACQEAREAEPADCEVCQDQGEVSNGPAPYDTDECPACTRVK